MKFLKKLGSLITILSIFAPGSANAYLGPGLGFGLSTIILIVLASIAFAMLMVFVNLYKMMFKNKKNRIDREKIDHSR